MVNGKASVGPAPRPTVIGVVTDAIPARLHERSAFALYEPLDPASEMFGRLLVRVAPGATGVVQQVKQRLRAVDPHQREVAAVLGASPRRVWREIDLRVIARAAAVAAGFAFAISLGEFGATLFIVRPETTTVPIAIYRYLARPGATNVAEAYTLATTLMILTAAIALAGDRVRTRAGRH